MTDFGGGEGGLSPFFYYGQTNVFFRFHKVRLLLHPFPEPLQLFLAGVLQNDFALFLRAFQLDLESRCAAQTLGQLLVFNRRKVETPDSS